RFMQSSYSFAVRENQPTHTEVGAVSAIDSDSGAFGDVTYSIVELFKKSSPSQSNDDLFGIDPKTGSIFTVRHLDREEQAMHHLKIIASDGGEPSRSGFCYVTIHVADENDNAPIFE
ncbi:hypothetical protein HELRODRAFT_136928, partial [Helobdella robusta]|uniref:Cadherin domain-containing protein n=1 Tax=Helobdella robusta TaxID=6412 RepID=T1EIG6_HELRO